MVPKFLRLVLTTVVLCGCDHTPDATGPLTFRLPVDDKNKNSNVINAIAFSPDGRLVAAAFGKWKAGLGDPIPGQVVIWDAKSGRHQSALMGHADGVSCVAFSTNGKQIATAGHHGNIKLWQTETFQETAGIRVKGRITSIAFSPDDKFLAVGCNNLGTSHELEDNLELYEITTGKKIRQFEGHRWGIEGVAFSPAGQILASCSGGRTVKLWDFTTRKPIATLIDGRLNSRLMDYVRIVFKKRKFTVEDLPTSIESVAFSPDGQRLAIAGGMMSARGREFGIGAVTIWDVETRKVQGRLTGYDISVEEVQFSPDGKQLATAGRDGSIRLWDSTTLRELNRFPGSAPIAFTPDGEALVFSTGQPSQARSPLVRPALELQPLKDSNGNYGSREKEKDSDELVGLSRLWSVGHDYLWDKYDAYLSPVYDARSKEIIALRHAGQCDVLGLDGKLRQSFTVDADMNTLRLARLSETNKSEFVGFRDPWGDSITAFDTSGKMLWQLANDDALNDVWTADLDGNGRDAVIVGYNGSGGLHLFNYAGERQWKNKQLTNVWHVTAGDVIGDKRQEVIATTGELHIFETNGKPLKPLAPPFEPSLTCTVRLAKNDRSETMLVAGSGETGLSLAALDGTGKVLWKQTGIKKWDRINSMVACPTRPWAALCASERGQVIVIDYRNGQIIAEAGGLGSYAQIAWATGDDGDTPILLVATIRNLSAFNVKTEGSKPTSKR